MKWLFILFSIFRPLMSSSEMHPMPNPVAELKDLIKKNAVVVMISFGTVFTLATIFTAGLVMIAVDIGAQFDKNAVVYFSATILSGIILMFVPSIISFSLIKRYDHRKDQYSKRPALQNTETAHPLQDALTLLVHDFVKEREMKRAKQEELSRPKASERQHPNHSSTDPIVPTADEFVH